MCYVYVCICIVFCECYCVYGGGGVVVYVVNEGDQTITLFMGVCEILLRIEHRSSVLNFCV